MRETVKIPLHSSRQCVCCFRRKPKYKLKTFPSNKIPELYSNHQILIPQKKSNICSICLKQLKNDTDIRIPTKSVSVNELVPKMVLGVLKLVSKWKKRVKYQSMSEKDFQEMGFLRQFDFKAEKCSNSE